MKKQKKNTSEKFKKFSLPSDIGFDDRELFRAYDALGEIVMEIINNIFTEKKTHEKPYPPGTLYGLIKRQNLT